LDFLIRIFANFGQNLLFFSSRNPDFSVLARFCVLKCIDWSLGKIHQLSDAKQECWQSTTNV